MFGWEYHVSTNQPWVHFRNIKWSTLSRGDRSLPWLIKWVGATRMTIVLEPSYFMHFFVTILQDHLVRNSRSRRTFGISYRWGCVVFKERSRTLPAPSAEYYHIENFMSPNGCIFSVVYFLWCGNDKNAFKNIFWPRISTFWEGFR